MRIKELEKRIRMPINKFLHHMHWKKDMMHRESIRNFRKFLKYYE